MISSDVIDDFTEKLKKEKIEYFLFLAKKPNKSQQKKNPELDLNIAHYQEISMENLLVLNYCLTKMLATGSFDPNVPWEEDGEGDGDESWK